MPRVLLGILAALVVLAATRDDEDTVTPPRTAGPSPAARRALADADRRWPNRKRASDGIMGDAAHQARPSDHNVGNAVDVTHDPAGPTGDELAELAIGDPRVSYVIWSRRIWSAGRGWRPYTGPDPHTSHVHVSIRATAREDASPWPWAQGVA